MFICAPIRRIYIEPSSEDEDLKKQIAVLEARVETLKRDRLLLMDRCDSAIIARDTHAEGEKAARQDATETRREAQDMRRKYEAMKTKYQGLKEQCVNSVLPLL